MAKHRAAVSAGPPAKVTAPLRFPLAPLLLLLAGSGCAALIYEIVWFQLLQLVLGSSAVSLGLLLATFMGGLCLGSAAFTRFVPRNAIGRYAPRQVYAMLQLAIGAVGILALFGVPLIGDLSLMVPIAGLAGLVFRGFITGLCLLPAALLMGATFPAAARWIEERWIEDRAATPAEESTRGSVVRVGLLYAANICGGSAGCVLAGFYLLRVHDLSVATYTAAAINAAVALIAFLVSGTAGAAAKAATGTSPLHAGGLTWIYLSIGLLGLAAVGAEVVWTRQFSLLLGDTVYTFSIVLAVFLVGIWAGSACASAVVRYLRSDARLALAACELLIVVACAWTAHTIASLPTWPIDPTPSINPWINFQLDVIRCVWAILPAALFWGASFPLALVCATREGEDSARLTGEVYAANTAGGILGALLFSVILIPSAGTSGSQQILLWIVALGAMAALIPLLSVERGAMRFGAGCAAAVILALACGLTIPSVPWQTIAYGRRVATALHAAHLGTEVQTTPLFVGEGVDSSVVISQRGEDRVFFVSGKSKTSSAPADMRLQRMMGHLPALVHPHAASVLVVGFGAGITAGSFVPYPEVRSIVICELERLIPPASSNFFSKQNNNVISDSRTHLLYDDARHYIQTTSDKFDVITTDPIHPWVKGASALNSREYYEQVKAHLNPGGVAAQWLPLYESDENTVKAELATFFSVFPGAMVWSNYLESDGYSLVLLGRAEESPIDVDVMDRRLNSSGYAAVSASLAEVRFPSAVDLLGTYAGRAPDLQSLIAGAQINDDSSMRLQSLAESGISAPESARLYHEILGYRSFPEGLLTGTGERIAMLRERLGRAALTF